MIRYIFSSIFLSLLFFACNGQPVSNSAVQNKVPAQNTVFDTTTKTIHVLVALCDNKYQGIVPVPKAIGNGQDPANNLYWGCAYGIKTFFKKSKDWKFLKSIKIDSVKLERVIFKHATKNYYLVGDAYNGKYIRQTTKDLLNSYAGKLKDVVEVDGVTLGIYGNSPLVVYIGHDGLMDFKINDDFSNTDGQTRNAIILACYSKRFFGTHLKQTKANPLVWSTHLMAPEAYVLHDALTGYVNNENGEAIRTRAAKAYNQYQKCGEKAARNLLVTGW